MHARGYTLVAAAAVLWALIGLFSRSLLDQGITPLEIAFWRALLAGVAFTLHALAVGRLRVRDGVDLLRLTGFALVGVTLFYAALVLAIDTGGISLAFVLLYTAPAFVTLLAWPLLGERIDARTLVLVALALCGVVMVAFGGGDGTGGVRVSAASIGWGLAAGISYASYYLFGKWVLARYEPVTIFAFVLPIGALGLLPFVDFGPKSALAWLALVALSLTSTYLAYLAYYSGLRHVPASRAVLVATVEPVAAAALAAAVYGERLGPWGVAGGALILVAAVGASLRRTRRGVHSRPGGASAAAAGAGPERR